MYRRVGLFFIILFNCSFIYCQNLDSLVQNVINQINLDSLSSYVEILSGKKEWELNDTSHTIRGRFALMNDSNIAADYLKYKLESWELEVYDSIYRAIGRYIRGRNIYAIQQGSLYPNQYYLICAHYDSVPPLSDAPGADDNASGVANVLETARILRSYNPTYSIIYALWDEEELGWYGSLYFAEQASINDLEILGVINIDMIGWDYNNDFQMEIHALTDTNTTSLIETLFDVNNSYNLGLTLFTYIPGSIGSDHYPFYLYDYPAIEVIQRNYGGDFNWYYHTSNDKFEHFNVPYFHQISKLTIGALAKLAFDFTTSMNNSKVMVSDFSLFQNFPNPFNPSTTIRYQIPELSLVTLNVYDVLGNEIATLVNEERPAGNYTIQFDSNGLSSGTYFYQIKAGFFTETKKMILLR